MRSEVLRIKEFWMQMSFKSRACHLWYPTAFFRIDANEQTNKPAKQQASKQVFPVLARPKPSQAKLSQTNSRSVCKCTCPPTVPSSGRNGMEGKYRYWTVGLGLPWDE